MIEPQTGSVGKREAGREAKVLGNVAERAVESYLTLSLMPIDSSITERGEGLLGCRFSPHSRQNHTAVPLASRVQTHIHTNSLQVPFFSCTRQFNHQSQITQVYLSSLLHSQGMASFSQDMWVGGINILQGSGGAVGRNSKCCHSPFLASIL